MDDEPCREDVATLLNVERLLSSGSLLVILTSKLPLGA
jgi:hypothetical protein